MSSHALVIALVLDPSHRLTSLSHGQVPSDDFVNETCRLDRRVQLFDQEPCKELLLLPERYLNSSARTKLFNEKPSTARAAAAPTTADKGNVAAQAITSRVACSHRTRRTPALVLAPARPAVMVWVMLTGAPIHATNAEAVDASSAAIPSAGPLRARARVSRGPTLARPITVPVQKAMANNASSGNRAPTALVPLTATAKTPQAYFRASFAEYASAWRPKLPGLSHLSRDPALRPLGIRPRAANTPDPTRPASNGAMRPAAATNPIVAHAHAAHYPLPPRRGHPRSPWSGSSAAPSSRGTLPLPSPH